MKWIPNVDKSLRILTWTFIATIGYHISILLQIIPYEYVWGGRLKSEQEMFQFETFSLLLNVLFLVFSIVLLKKKALQKTKPIKAVFYVFAALFFLNTLGNAVAVSPFEKYFFTPLTLIMALLCLKIAIGEKD